MVAFCKFYLQGLCQRGAYCKFKHSGPPLPTATVIRQPAIVPEFTPETLTSLVDGVKVTFAAGLVPRSIELLATTRPSMQVEALDTSLGVTWYRASRNVWLSLNSKSHLDKAVRSINGRILAGVTLSAKIQKSYVKDVFSVQISSVPKKINEQDITALLPDDVLPKSVKMGPFSYNSDDAGKDMVMRKIRQHTSQPVKHVNFRTPKNPGKIHAEFVFEDMPNLQRLATEMNGAIVQEFDGAKIFVEECLLLKLIIKKKLYAPKAREAKALTAAIWKEHKVQVHIQEDAPAKSQHVSISITATNRSLLVAAKAQLNNFFGRPPSGKDTTGIDLLCKQTHRIRLTKTKAYRDAKALLGKIKEDFGDETVVLDDKAEPPALVVTGDTLLLRKIQKAFKGYGHQTRKVKTVSCSSCLDDEVIEFVKLDGCGHTNCLDCFRSYCMVDRDGKFPLRCFEPGCEQAISVADLQTKLEGDGLQGLLHWSLHDHFQRHPKECAGCPGDGCKTRYLRSGAEDRRRLCSECLTRTCTNCNVQYHTGMTCKEYEDTVTNDEGLVRWMEEQGAKKCPMCGAVTQKEEGCNNVNCSSCHCDFCWRCLAIFESHDEVYRHLVNEHGGYFDDEAEEMDRIQRELPEAERVINGLPVQHGWRRVPRGLFQRLARQEEDERLARRLQALGDEAFEQAMGQARAEGLLEDDNAGAEWGNGRANIDGW